MRASATDWHEAQSTSSLYSYITIFLSIQLYIQYSPKIHEKGLNTITTINLNGNCITQILSLHNNFL